LLFTHGTGSGGPPDNGNAGGDDQDGDPPGRGNAFFQEQHGKHGDDRITHAEQGKSVGDLHARKPNQPEAGSNHERSAPCEHPAGAQESQAGGRSSILRAHSAFKKYLGAGSEHDADPKRGCRRHDWSSFTDRCRSATPKTTTAIPIHRPVETVSLKKSLPPMLTIT